MADRYWVGEGANTSWSTVGNWSGSSGGVGGASVPGSVDKAIFDGIGASANGTSVVTASTHSVLELFITSGFTGTLTINAGILVSVGANITLGANMVLTGSGSLQTNTLSPSTSTLTSNGKALPDTMSFNVTNNGVRTFADNWTVGFLNLYTSGMTLNGGVITVNRNMNVAASTASAGTASIIMKGTPSGTWLGTGRIANDLTLDGNITVSGSVAIGGTATLKYLSGTITTTGSTLTVGDNTSLNTNGMVWNNMNLSNTAGKTLISNCTVLGNVAVTSNTSIFSSNLYIGGTLSMSNPLGGTATIIFTGPSSAWTGNQTLSCSVTFAGNTGIGSVTFGGPKLLYQSGTIGAATSFVFTGTSIVDMQSVPLNNVTLAGPKTLLSDLVTTGTTSIGTFSSSAFKVIIKGDLVLNTSMSGSTELVFNGNTTWTGAGTILSNITFDGNVIMSMQLIYGTGTIRYLSGVVTSTEVASLAINGNCTLDTYGALFNKVSNIAGALITINSTLVAASYTTAQMVQFTGIAGWVVDDFIVNSTTVQTTLTFQNGIEYIINNIFSSNRANYGKQAIFQSNSATIKAKITMNGGICSVTSNFTRIDAGNGRTIWTWNGVVVDCININPYADKIVVTTGLTF